MYMYRTWIAISTQQTEINEKSNINRSFVFGDSNILYNGSFLKNSLDESILLKKKYLIFFVSDIIFAIQV